MSYELALPPTMKVHDVFHVSFIKIYVKDVYHVIDWFVLQMELEGEFQPKLQFILQWKPLMLYNREIEQVKL